MTIPAGADVPGMLLDSLVRLGGEQDAEPSLDIMCCTGDFIIVDNTANSKALPFGLGQVMDVDDDSAIVQWYHPSTSKESNLRAGRKKSILDLFGEWQALDALPVDGVEPLPPSVLSPSKILIWGFHLEDNNLVPFKVLDQIMDLDFVDLTGQKMSSTKRGTMYRAHRLMRAQ